jgi:molybdopterin molybdotransferase
MTSEADTLAMLLDLVQPSTATESIDLHQALNRRIAQDLHAGIPLPGFDKSLMDGYALRAADTQSPQTTLSIMGEQAAGHSADLQITAPGQAIRIFTGAPIPAGADAVIMQEDTERSDTTLRCTCPVIPGENIGRQGSDVCMGQKILSVGDAITPAKIALLASQGIHQLRVFTRPSIAILSTGSELVPADGSPLLPGQIYNSNGPMLAALVSQLTGQKATLAHAPDDLASTIQILRQLILEHDMILISGGVSVGDKDFIKPALQQLELPPKLWRIRLKPGKPFLFSHRQDPKPLLVFGLPGHPVSAFVTFQVFVRPAILKAGGAPTEALPALTVPARLSSALRNHADRPHYLRGIYQNGSFTAAATQQSDAILVLSQSNALLRVDANTALEAGQLVHPQLL